MEYKRLDKILQRIGELKIQILNMFQLTDDKEFTEEYNSVAIQLEKLTDYCRNGYISETNADKKLYLTKVADTLGISVKKKWKKIIITLPCLLPKRQTINSDMYLTEPLATVLMDFAESQKKFRKWEYSLIEIKSVYTEDTKYRIKDNDNIEVRHIINIISTVFLVDDNNADIYLRSRMGDYPHTEITVSERKVKKRCAK